MTTKKFSFREYQVYRDSKNLFSNILRIVKRIPKEYRYELGSQVVRSSLSVVLNIAEGCGRSSSKELNRFLDISLGSLYEVLATCDVLCDNKLISQKEFDEIHDEVSNISNQLGGFKKKVMKS